MQQFSRRPPAPKTRARAVSPQLAPAQAGFAVAQVDLSGISVDPASAPDVAQPHVPASAPKSGTSPAQTGGRTPAVAQLVKYTRTRKMRSRATKRKYRVLHNPMRGSAGVRMLRQAKRDRSEDEFNEKTHRRLRKAARLGATRTRPATDVLSYARYPAGSYGGGRYQYLTGHLDNLGKRRNDLMDFDNAPVEIDHSPHDGSQRRNERRTDDALMYRVAVPLPRNWHRRHKTTHGAGATRYDRDFVDEQRDHVQHNRYYEALQNHLLDTLSDGAIGGTGHVKVGIVLDHMNDAIDYAASDIPVKLHPHHKKNTPVISPVQAASIRAHLRARVNALRGNPNYSLLHNPF